MAVLSLGSEHHQIANISPKASNLILKSKVNIQKFEIKYVDQLLDSITFLYKFFFLYNLDVYVCVSVFVFVFAA